MVAMEAGDTAGEEAEVEAETLQTPVLRPSAEWEAPAAQEEPSPARRWMEKILRMTPESWGNSALIQASAEKPVALTAEPAAATVERAV